MTSRALIPVLCIGAVAFACGPRTHDEASAKKNGTAFAATATERAPRPVAAKSAKQSNAPVTAQLVVRATDSSIRLALHVTNTTKKSVEITFPSGQTHDFVILDAAGRELWRWAQGRMFTQSLRNRPLGGGEGISLEETWNAATLPPGVYTAKATLKSQNYPLVQTTEFVVRETTVAAR